MNPIDPLLTPEDVAKILQFKTSTVYSMVHRGVLPGFKIGGKLVRIRQAALAKYLEEREKKSYGKAA